MCGICGIAGACANSNVAEMMNRSLRHRGPDGSGLYQDEGVVLGHTRLSIIDLQTGDQPMTNEDRSIWVVFNGEIYNYRELRRDLAECGHRFHSTSDTEVLVHLYEEHGDMFLSRLDGIFAFALWDTRRRRLLLARDYAGVKPLHYHFDGVTLRFGSEVKAILQDPAVLRNVDYQALHCMLNLRYIPGERTLFDGIKRLLPSHYLVFEDGRLRISRYFELKIDSSSRHSEADYMEGLRHHVREAVRKQMVSDVPLGVYLSGGLDSSSIVAFMSQLVDHPVQTFAMGFNEPTDELDDACCVAEHFDTNHHAISLNPDPLRDYPKAIWYAEEPKENVLQGYLLAQFARQHVKVVLSGLGGDELFMGYLTNQYIYATQSLHKLVPSIIHRHLFQPLSRGIFVLQNATDTLWLDLYRRGIQMLLALGDPEQYYLIVRNTWDYDSGAFAKLYGPLMRAQSLALVHTQFDELFAVDQRTVMDQVLWSEFQTKMINDFLVNEDRTSMAHGLEARVPFLDRDLVRFAFSIPVDLKIRGNETKYIFRKAMQGLLPEPTLRKKKWGFSFNPYYQFQKDLRPVAERILTQRRVEQQGLFNYNYIRKILDHPAHPSLRWHYFFLWNLVGFQIWYSMFIEGDVQNPSFDLEAYY